MKADTNGRQYAEYSKLTPGFIVQVDSGMNCIPANATRVVQQDSYGMYIKCRCGHHYLDGQLADEGDFLVGIYPL